MIDKNFIHKWIERLEAGELRNFPGDFTNETENKTEQMPGKILVLGPELFGAYELLDPEGNSQYQADNLLQAKFVLYSNRSKPEEIPIPLSLPVLEEAVKNYEKHLDGIVKQILEEYKKAFPNSTNHNEATNQIFSALKLQRY